MLFLSGSTCGVENQPGGDDVENQQESGGKEDGDRSRKATSKIAYGEEAFPHQVHVNQTDFCWYTYVRSFFNTDRASNPHMFQKSLVPVSLAGPDGVPLGEQVHRLLYQPELDADGRTLPRRLQGGPQDLRRCGDKTTNSNIVGSSRNLSKVRVNAKLAVFCSLLLLQQKILCYSKLKAFLCTLRTYSIQWYGRSYYYITSDV